MLNIRNLLPVTFSTCHVPTRVPIARVIRLMQRKIYADCYKRRRPRKEVERHGEGGVECYWGRKFDGDYDEGPD